MVQNWGCGGVNIEVRAPVAPEVEEFAKGIVGAMLPIHDEPVPALQLPAAVTQMAAVMKTYQDARSLIPINWSGAEFPETNISTTKALVVVDEFRSITMRRNWFEKLVLRIAKKMGVAVALPKARGPFGREGHRGVAFVGHLGSAVVAATVTTFFVALLVVKLKEGGPRNSMLRRIGAYVQPGWMEEEEIAEDIMKNCFPKTGRISRAAENKLVADGWLDEFMQSMPAQFDKLHKPYLDRDGQFDLELDLEEMLDEDDHQQVVGDLAEALGLGAAQPAVPQVALAPDVARQEARAAVPQVVPAQDVAEEEQRAAAPQAALPASRPPATPLSGASGNNQLSTEGKPKRYVEQRRTEGADNSTIRQELRSMGYSKSRISQLAPATQNNLAEEREAPAPSRRRLQ